MMDLSKNPLAISSFSLPSISEKVMDECSNSGIKMLELAFGKICEGADDVCEIQKRWLGIIDAATKKGIDIWSAHLPFGDGYDFSLCDKDARERALEKQMEMMRFLRENTSVKTVVVHPSSEPVFVESRFMQTEHAKAALGILADEAQGFGAQIAVECLPRTCLGNNIDSMAKLVSSDLRLRICFDTNHLLCEKNEDFIKAFGEKIITLHISDYNGEDELHLMPYEGKNDWKKIFGLLLKMGYTGPVLFEISDKCGYTISQVGECYKKFCCDIV